MPRLNERSRALRASRVGASEVAAIMGLDPYRGPMSVWARISLGEQQPQTERMAIGAALEATIARMWAERSGSRIRLNTRTRTRGNLAATADAYALDRGALLEIKWSAHRGMWADGLPPHVRWQAIAQSRVYRGVPVIVAGLIEGQLLEWLVEPTRAERAECRDAVDRFMELYVETGEIPIPLWPGELAAYLRLTQGSDAEARRPATAAEQRIGARFIKARNRAKLATDRAEALRAELLGLIAHDARPRIVGDGWLYQSRDERITIHETGAPKP